MRLSCLVVLILLHGLGLLCPSSSVWSAAADPHDWPMWRGPQQNGVSLEIDLPDRFTLAGENLLWRKPEFATRSTPIVLNGRLYAICRHEPETTREGERVVCLDGATSELVWQAVNNVFLSDAPAERVGWSSVVGDPETGNVYALGLGCFFQCLDGEQGKPVWQHSMSEEYGMLSTYGGRTNFPVIFDNLVIISGVMTGWGDYAVPAHRLIAFDKRTGQAVWILSTRLRPEDTTYSTPVLTSFNGEAALVFGAGDGSVYAVQPRTGKVIWEYHASTRGINTTPLVFGGRVYCGHSEQNMADTTVLGSVFAFDGRTTGVISEEKLLWKVPARTVGRCQPLLYEGRLYTVDDGGTMWITDPETGQDIGRHKLGRIMMGSMVAGDGKIYVGEATGRWYVLQPTEQGVKVLQQLRLNQEEILGSPIIAHGRIYLPTLGALYCLGHKDRQPSNHGSPVSLVDEPSAKPDEPVAQLQIYPVESLLKPGDRLPLEVRAYNARGQFLKNVKVTWSVTGIGQVNSASQLVVPPTAGHATAIIKATAGELTASARARVVPALPWKFDMQDGQVPPTWIGAAYRHKPVEFDGEKVLVKVSTIPKGTRSQSWMGPTNLHDNTVQADVRATMRDEKLPDMGVINQRYTLDMMGAKQQLQLRSWTSRLQLRFAETVPFEWQAGKWYTIKLRCTNRDGKAVLQGKVWERGTAEPEGWQIEAADSTPNVTGSPGLFGNASDAEFYIDNVIVTPNEKST